MPKKLIVILGPTASGKSDLAVKLALRLGSGRAEIVSADSRQIYKGLNIGSGKITKKEMRGIPHHLLDIASPKRIFTVSQYRKLAVAAINKIQKKNKVPILCGGTGFYIQSVVDGITIPEIKPDWKLRKKLEKKPAKKLYQMLKKLDPRRARNIDQNNPRRLIRALEIVIKTKKAVPALKTNPLSYPVLMIGVRLSKKNLQTRIKKRVEKMMKSGLEKEAKKFSLPMIGYQEWSFPNPKDLIIRHTIQYAKRQMTWFKRDKRIRWVKNYQQVTKLIKKYL